jgi:hypothetical protein
LNKLMTGYREWAFALWPGLHFEDMIPRLENMGKKNFITNGVQRLREKEMLYSQRRGYEAEKEGGEGGTVAPFDPMVDPIRDRLEAAAKKLNEANSPNPAAISPSGGEKETVQQRIEKKRQEAMAKLAKKKRGREEQEQREMEAQMEAQMAEEEYQFDEDEEAAAEMYEDLERPTKKAKTDANASSKKKEFHTPAKPQAEDEANTSTDSQGISDVSAPTQVETQADGSTEESTETQIETQVEEMAEDSGEAQVETQVETQVEEQVEVETQVETQAETQAEDAV